MKFVSSKSDIKSFPFADYSTLGTAELEKQAEAHSLTAFNIWMMPQLSSLFGNFKVRKDDAGKYLPLAILQDNIGKDPYMVGIWRVVTKLTRGSLVKAQNTPAFAEYSALVPLILAGIKKYQGIPYSAYAVEGLEHIMNTNLHEAMTCGYEGTLSKNRLLELRVEGLTYKTGPKAGQVVKPISKWAPTGIAHTEIGQLPKLAQTMLTQIWVADPSLRSPYMVLDPLDWDNMPEPLVVTEVISTKTAKVLTAESLEVPW